MVRRSTMRLEVENFAKLKKAVIEVNGITVLAGENDTGKSIIGKILYCIYTAFHDLNKKILFEKQKDIINVLFENNLDRALSDIDVVLGDVNRLLNLENVNFETIKEVLFKNQYININDELIERISEYLKFDNEVLKDLVVKRIFDEEFNYQISPVFDEHLVTNIKLFIKDEKIEVEFNSDRKIIQSEIDLHNDGILIDNPFLLDDIQKKNKDLRFLNPKFFYFFDDGNKYKHSSRLNEKLSKSLIENNNSLIDEAILKKRIEKILDRIINITHGDFSEKETKFMFLNKIFDKEIELSNLSTGVKSFAVIMKLLKNKDIRDNSIIILDEPEVHLHPKWQLKYAELLVLLQQEFNLNIVLTTHSPYFVRAIQVYSAKYNLADKCKYYLSSLDDEYASTIEDVTIEVDKIYAKFAEPLQTLVDIETK